MNWIKSFESKFILLEDDCFINQAGFVFFDKYTYLLDEGVSLLSETSPWALPQNIGISSCFTLSNYPLIWGWATSGSNWHKMTQLGKIAKLV